MQLISKGIWFIAGFLLKIYLKTKKNIRLGKNIRFKKFPLLQIHKKAQLIIGDNVIINSDNTNYHFNMHSHCKLMLDKPGALIQIGDNSRIHGTCIHAYTSVIIGRNCLIAANTQIMDGNAHDVSFNDPSNRINTHGTSKPVNIKDNVWIGANVIILPGVTIGEGSIISAGSVVNKSIPENVIACGNPAVVLPKNPS